MPRGVPNKPKAFRGFIHVQPEHAAVAKTPKAPRTFSDIPISQLLLTDSQKAAIDQIYEDEAFISLAYDVDNEEDQLSAASMLASHRLDWQARAAIGNKWNIRWTVQKGEGSKATCRVLLQCGCGYDHTLQGTKQRQNPVVYTGCLAHAEITYLVASCRILMIRGHLEHNQACDDVQFTRLPSMRLHPEVFKVALQQLKMGACIASIKDTNKKMIETKAYRGQAEALQGSTGSHSLYRWKFKPSDSRSLYRQYNRLQGINVTQKDHINLDDWLNPGSPQYNRTLHEAIFHYSARQAKEERLEVCIMTPAMRDAAWRYGHHSEILLDGTFGVCNKKMLLFIAMGVDERNRGVPLAFFLFSAPSNNQRTSSGYDADIIEKLLRKWKEGMGTRNGEEFAPYVAITDTDLMERNALLRVFPSIWLLICKFHLRQSWSNHRKQVRGSTQVHVQVKGRLRKLEDALIETETFEAAQELVEHERQVLLAQSARENTLTAEENAAIEGALDHVRYLKEYWLKKPLWSSWSRYSRLEAARRMGRTINEVVPTTNHLESFNKVLKRGHLGRVQRGGRRVRLDFLIRILVFSVFPSIFRQRALDDEELAQRAELIRSLPGGEALLEKEHGRQVSRSSTALAYLVPDTARDAAAIVLVNDRQISAPSAADDSSQLFLFTCYSSLALEDDEDPETYKIVLSTFGIGSCTCKDFANRGGACKHMRAALNSMENLRAVPGSALPKLYLPPSFEEACALRSGRVADTLPELDPIEDAIADAVNAINDLFLETGPDLDDTESEQGDDACHKSSSTASSLQVSRESSPVSELLPLLKSPLSSATADSSHTGLANQTVSRVLYELEHNPAKYAQYAQWLQNISLSPNDDASGPLLAALMRCREDFDLFAAQVDRLLAEATPTEPILSAQPTTPSQAPVPLPQTARGLKRPASMLLGVSPEKRQIRHNSFAPH